MTLHTHHDSPVLGQAPLGNVQICQQLDARNDRGRETLIHLRRCVLQHTVDAIADA